MLERKVRKNVSSKSKELYDILKSKQNRKVEKGYECLFLTALKMCEYQSTTTYELQISNPQILDYESAWETNTCLTYETSTLHIKAEISVSNTLEILLSLTHDLIPAWVQLLFSPFSKALYTEKCWKKIFSPAKLCFPFSVQCQNPTLWHQS